MGIVEKTQAAAPSRLADVDRFRLRRFVEGLGDDLEAVSAATDLADVAAILEGNPKAVLFGAVGPERQELVGNVTGSRARIARAFGVKPNELLPELLRRLRNKADVIDVSRAEAPAQQVVLTGDDADLTTLPVHLGHGADGAPYISSSIDFVVDPKNGWTNVGVRRLMLRGRREAGIDLVSPSDLRAIYEASAAAGKPLPVSFVVGAHPIDHIAAVMRLPMDDLALISMLRGAPLPVVKCVTNDVRVPADAEWVLEVFLDPRGHVEPEGPYGEFLGYYGAVKRNPVFHLKAITRRRDALFQTSTIGGLSLARTDTAQLAALRTEVTVWRALETAVREIRAVYASPATGGMFNVRVAMQQRVPGEARNAIAAVFASLANVKHVFVVDPDIDIFSDEQMDWALATRFQADRDMVMHGGMRAMPLDPSLAGATVTAKLGFDLTLPLLRPGEQRDLAHRGPTPPVLTGALSDTRQAALEHGPKRFTELMSATGTRDGREIVRWLEETAATRAIVRDEEGRYAFA